MGGFFDKNEKGWDENFRDCYENEPETIGFLFLITLGWYAFKTSTVPAPKWCSLFIVGMCVSVIGYCFFWLRHIIKKRDKTIKELKRK